MFTVHDMFTAHGQTDKQHLYLNTSCL